MKITQTPLQTARRLTTSFLLASLLGITGTVSAQTLLLRYNFDESATGTENAIDSGATPAANGTLVGAARVGTTPGNFSLGALESVGGASGNLRYVIASDLNGEVDKLDGLASFTLSAWINVQELPAGNRRLISKQAAGSFSGFTWNIADSLAGGPRAANNFGLRMFVGGDAGFFFDTSAVTIDADNKWVFVALTYDGTLSADNVKYYVGDTASAATNQATTTIAAGTTLASTAAFGIGYTDAAPTANTAFPGWVDDARVYSGVLTEAQLDAVRLENLPGVTPPSAVTLTNVNRSGNTVTFDFISQSGHNHRVEFKDTLTNASWQVLTNIAGTGSSVTATDANATTDTRFYQVVTQ
jgi:hypothetical protein